MELGTLWESSGGMGGGLAGARCQGLGPGPGWDVEWDVRSIVLTTAAIDCRQDYGRRRHPGSGLKGGGDVCTLCAGYGGCGTSAMGLCVFTVLLFCGFAVLWLLTDS